MIFHENNGDNLEILNAFIYKVEIFASRLYFKDTEDNHLVPKNTIEKKEITKNTNKKPDSKKM